MPARVILFDVMDTLVHDPFYNEVLTHLGLSLEEVFRVKDKAASHAFERGELAEADMVDRYFTDRPLDLEAYRDCLARSYRYLDGIEPLLAELASAGVAMHALSNYPVWYTIIETRLGLAQFVSWRFVSCRTGIRKPNPDAYLGAARALAVEPSDCLFVDDRQKNCDGAAAVGMDSIRFESTDRLREALVNRGFLGPFVTEA